MKTFFDDTVLARALSAAGFSAAETEKVLTASKSPAAAEQLKRNGEEAVAAGAFGVPSFFLTRPGIAGEELFWGSDRVACLAHFLGVKNWVGRISAVPA